MKIISKVPFTPLYPTLVRLTFSLDLSKPHRWPMLVVTERWGVCISVGFGSSVCLWLFLSAGLLVAYCHRFDVWMGNSRRIYFISCVVGTSIICCARRTHSNAVFREHRTLYRNSIVGYSSSFRTQCVNCAAHTPIFVLNCSGTVL